MTSALVSKQLTCANFFLFWKHLVEYLRLLALNVTHAPLKHLSQNVDENLVVVSVF